ncbi:MAG: hypothetical protein RIF39_11100, partial [Cyclobacteriaceae bacterium]
MRKIFATILFAAPWTSVSAQNIVFTSDEVVINIEGFLIADVFMTEAGTGIVTWIESNGNVFARRFDVNGNFLAPQFLVGFGSIFYYPQIDGDADGNFIVTWEAFNSI